MIRVALRKEESHELSRIGKSQNQQFKPIQSWLAHQNSWKTVQSCLKNTKTCWKLSSVVYNRQIFFETVHFRSKLSKSLKTIHSQDNKKLSRVVCSKHSGAHGTHPESSVQNSPEYSNSNVTVFISTKHLIFINFSEFRHRNTPKIQNSPLIAVHWQRPLLSLSSLTSRPPLFAFPHTSAHCSFRSSSRRKAVSTLMTCHNGFSLLLSCAACDIFFKTNYNVWQRRSIKVKRAKKKEKNCVKLVRSTSKSAIEKSKRLRNKRAQQESAKKKKNSRSLNNYF